MDSNNTHYKSVNMQSAGNLYATNLILTINRRVKKLNKQDKDWIFKYNNIFGTGLALMFPQLKLMTRKKTFSLFCIFFGIFSAALLILVQHKQNNERKTIRISKEQDDHYWKNRKMTIQNDLLEYYATPHDPFVNQHRYTYSILSAACTNKTFHVVFVVHSKPSNYHRRELIRTTYGSVKKYKGKSLTVVFMIGAVHDTLMQNLLLHEAKTFNDIVQGNFIDSYQNLSMKHIMDMHWFKNNCEADFVMKVDDDTFVNPYRLVEYLILIPKNDINIYCKVALDTETPDRQRSSKTYTPIDKYPFDAFPDFCLGFAYITTPNVWRVLYNSSTYYRALPVDDVYVTGILASLSGIERKDIGYVMYDCSKYLDKYDALLFRESVVVLDRRNECINETFKHWLDIQK